MKKALIIILLALFLITGCSKNSTKITEAVDTAEPVVEDVKEDIKEDVPVVTGDIVKEKLRNIILDEEFELEKEETNYFYFTTNKGEYFKIVVQMLDSGRYYNFALMTKWECEKYKRGESFTAIQQDSHKQNTYIYDEVPAEEDTEYCMVFEHDDENVIVKKRVKVESCNYRC